MGRSSFTKWVNQSPHFVLPLVHTGVSKTGKDLQYVHKKQDEINSKKWRRESDHQPFSVYFNEVPLLDVVFSQVVGGWHISPFISSYFSQTTATKLTGWTDVPPSPLCLALTWTQLIWVCKWKYLVSDEVSLSFSFFIFFPFCQVDWCFEHKTSFIFQPLTKKKNKLLTLIKIRAHYFRYAHQSCTTTC